MFLRIFRLTCTEIYKLVHQRFFYISLLVLPVFCALTIVSLYKGIIEDGQLFRDNAFMIMAFATDASILIAAFFVMALAGSTFAEERSYQTLKNLLSRPVRRIEFFTAKVMMVVFYITILMILIGVTSVIGGWMVYGLSDVNTSGEHVKIGGYIAEQLEVNTPLSPVGTPDNTTTELAYTSSGMLWNFFMVYIMYGMVLLAAGSAGLFISTLSNSIATGIIVSLAFHIAMQSARVIDSIEKFVYPDYFVTISKKISDATEAVRSFAWMPEMNYVFFGALVYILVFLSASALVFQRRDIVN